MKIRLTLVTLFTVLFSFPAMAGTINFNDGQGAWQSSRCQTPSLPQALSQNPEAAANDLNEQFEAHNQYAADAKKYMECVSQEAQADAAKAGQIIINSAQSLIKQTQSQVSTSASGLRAKPE